LPREFRKEPLRDVKRSPLTMDNVIATPHIRLRRATNTNSSSRHLRQIVAYAAGTPTTARSALTSAFGSISGAALV